jgi:hypothetical protein
VREIARRAFICADLTSIHIFSGTCALVRGSRSWRIRLLVRAKDRSGGGGGCGGSGCGGLWRIVTLIGVGYLVSLSTIGLRRGPVNALRATGEHSYGREEERLEKLADRFTLYVHGWD